jgi:hypothetical protein
MADGFTSLAVKVIKSIDANFDQATLNLKQLILSKGDSKADIERISRMNQFFNQYLEILERDSWEFNVLRMLVNFGFRQKGEQSKALVDDSGLGMLLFTSLLEKQDLWPTHELDLDVKGDISFDNTSVSITIGEIKSSCSTDSTKDAVKQLYIATCVAEKAIKVMNPHFTGGIR